MSRHLSTSTPTFGEELTPNVFGRLVGVFQSASHRPLKGGAFNSRHIYLALSTDDGGPFEAAVNIRSDEDTAVLYTRRAEDVGPAGLPAIGFQAGVKLAYGAGDGPSFLGLTDQDFQTIQNDDLYQTIAGLAQSSDRVGVYGVTYREGTGIHDVHMNSGTDPADGHARDDRAHEDGAIAFYNAMQIAGQQRVIATWVFVKFDSQTVVNG